ncbi:GAF domain-containing protein [Nocardia sp. NPDC052001]|uniref:GAF domain-containing protein n=1 Tax=Nocardia sp. NPDC052001 TaxID=3154853 RepID=UPI00342C022B
MRSGTAIPWMSAETLSTEALTVASVGSSARDFAAWQRVLQRQLTKTPALYQGLTPAGITDAVHAVRQRATDFKLTVPSRSGPHALWARPVLGPAGDVHGVQLWMGPAAEAAPPAPAAAGAIWDLESQTIAVPSGITELTGLSAEEYVPRLSIAELFQRISGFDRHAEVLDMLYEAKAGTKLQFDANVTSATGRAGRWRFTIRGRDDERARGAWWLIEDVTSDQPVTHRPTLENIGLREAHRRAGTSLAVMHLEHAGIAHWLTDPAPWIRWDYLFRPGDVFHPADREQLVELGKQVRAGYTAGATVRTLDYRGGYTASSLLVYPYPGYTSRPLAIVQFVCAGDCSPVPEPLCDTAGIPLAGVPIGYDEQLRYRLTGRKGRKAHA